MSQRCNNREEEEEEERGHISAVLGKDMQKKNKIKITSPPALAVKFYSAGLTNKSGVRRLSMGSNWPVYKTDHTALRRSVTRRGSVLTAGRWNTSSC